MLWERWPRSTPQPCLPIWPCLSCVVNHSRKVVANSQRTTQTYPSRECSAFLWEGQGRQPSRACGNKVQNSYICQKEFKWKQNNAALCFLSEGTFLQWRWSNLSGLSVCGAVAFCSWTHAVLKLTANKDSSAYTTKWHHLGNPFLFSQWKDGTEDLGGTVVSETHRTSKRQLWHHYFTKKKCHKLIGEDVYFCLMQNLPSLHRIKAGG